jgi:hypothetical protein
MCWKTDAGLVQSVGKISLDVPNDYPKFLQDFQYVIFKEEDNMLGLIYHAVCIDLVLDSRGTTPADACKGLKISVVSFIEVTLECFTDKSKAYDALKEQKENRDDDRKLVFRAYNEVLAHNETIFFEKLRPHYPGLYDSMYSKLKEVTKSKLKEIVKFHELSHIFAVEDEWKKHTNYFTLAYNEEEIEYLCKPQISLDEIKKIFAFNFLLSNSKIRGRIRR